MRGCQSRPRRTRCVPAAVQTGVRWTAHGCGWPQVTLACISSNVAMTTPMGMIATGQADTCITGTDPLSLLLLRLCFVGWGGRRYTFACRLGGRRYLNGDELELLTPSVSISHQPRRGDRDYVRPPDSVQPEGP